MKFNLRKEYGRHPPLRSRELNPDPLIQFHCWFQEALHGDIIEPNAFFLATATPEGEPSCRVLLMKDMDHQGLHFFTNSQSRKGKELAKNPRAAATFWWPSQERQVRFEGSVFLLKEEEAENYFASRTRESQISAWTSHQSEPINSREDLEDDFVLFQKKFESEKSIPKPLFWVGYCLKPSVIEFWQGASHRLHDRLVYYRKEAGWLIKRLSP